MMKGLVQWIGWRGIGLECRGFVETFHVLGLGDSMTVFIHELQQ
jgi:hypothetical protein